MQLVALVLEHLAQIAGHLACDVLHVRVQLAQIVGQTDQLVQRADLTPRGRKRTHIVTVSSIYNQYSINSPSGREYET